MSSVTRSSVEEQQKLLDLSLVVMRDNREYLGMQTSQRDADLWMSVSQRV